jgi:thiamine transporter
VLLSTLRNLNQVILAEGNKSLNTTYTSEYKNQNSFRNPKVLAETAIFVALGTALSFIIIYPFPQGGSITAASMVPLIWLALRRGPKVGVTGGVIYGLIQFAILPFIAPAPYALIQVLLDYPLAFGVLGLAGFFYKYPMAGAAVGISARFVMSFVSGVVFWAPVYAPNLNPFAYSAVYNGSYLLPELLISGFVLYLLQKSKVLKAYM